MKTSLKWVLALVIATSFVFVQTVGAEETTPADDIEIADFGSDAAIDRDSLVKSLAARWVDQSGESVEVLEQIFSSSTTEQLMVADEASSYEQVRDVLDSFGPSADYVYTPVNPCVIFDTRSGGGGVLFPGVPRQFQVYGNLFFQGGQNCPAPRGEPRAVHLNMTAIDVSGKGNMKASPVGADPNNGLGVNYNRFVTVDGTGANVANAGTVKTRFGLGNDIQVRATTFAHTRGQVLGYYYEVDPNDQDRLALAYGFIQDDSGGFRISHRTENVTGVSYASGRYEITISGVSYFYTNYTAVVTPGNSFCNDVTFSTNSVSGRLLVYIQDDDGLGAGANRRCSFGFAVYKDR